LQQIRRVLKCLNLFHLNHRHYDGLLFLSELEPGGQLMDLVWFRHGRKLDCFYRLTAFKYRFAQTMAAIHE
ncbi:MAG: hypothetical protein OXR71_03320, partial [Gemmatimonadota bacterium]|nr:hypothetical protein [Gemmatimonadota bacterium]